MEASSTTTLDTLRLVATTVEEARLQYVSISAFDGAVQVQIADEDLPAWEAAAEVVRRTRRDDLGGVGGKVRHDLDLVVAGHPFGLVTFLAPERAES